MYRISKCFWIIEIGDGVVKPSLCWQVVAIKLNSVGYRCLNKIYSIEICRSILYVYTFTENI